MATLSSRLGFRFVVLSFCLLTVRCDSCDGWSPSLEGKPGLVLGLRRSSPLIPDQYFAAPGFTHVTWRDDILKNGITHVTDEDPVKMMLKLQGPGIYLDVGANCGSTSLPVAAMKSKHRVYGFEPVPAMFNLLCASKAFGSTLYEGRLNYFHAAVSNASTPLRMFIPADREDNAAAGPDDRAALKHLKAKSRLWRKAATAKSVELHIKSISLDDFMESTVPLQHANLLKIDTQGHELQVLKGAEKSLRARRIQAVYAENELGLMAAAGVDPTDILAFMASVGFKPFRVEQYTVKDDVFTRVPGAEPLTGLTAAHGAGGDVLWLPADR